MEGNINDYAKEVAAHVKDYLPEEYGEGIVGETRKGRTLVIGITVRRADGSFTFPRPVILFYKSGITPSEAAKLIAADILSGAEDEQREQSRISLLLQDYEACRDKIFLRVFSTDGDIMVPKPSRSVAPWLSAICYVAVESVCDENVLFPVNVSTDILTLWGKSFDEVYAVAQENMKRVYTCMRMREALIKNAKAYARTLDMSQEEQNRYVMAAMIKFQDIPIYVLSAGLFGAGAIAVPEILSEVSRTIMDWCGFYIIPSSTEELLLIPLWYGMSTEEMKETIRDTNVKTVDPTKQLSDRLYLYKSGELLLA